MSAEDVYNLMAVESVLGSPLALPWVTLARQSWRTANPSYRHTEWPGPTPSAWYGTIFEPPKNPTAAVNLAESCADDLIRNNMCRGNPSCQLGVLAGVNSNMVNTADPTIDPGQFAVGRALQQQCVAVQVSSFFGQRGGIGSAF